MNEGQLLRVTAYFFFLSGLCVSADPAAVLEFLPVLPLFKTLDAALPARLLDDTAAASHLFGRPNIGVMSFLL